MITAGFKTNEELHKIVNFFLSSEHLLFFKETSWQRRTVEADISSPSIILFYFFLIMELVMLMTTFQHVCQLLTNERTAAKLSLLKTSGAIPRPSRGLQWCN